MKLEMKKENPVLGVKKILERMRCPKVITIRSVNMNRG